MSLDSSTFGKRFGEYLPYSPSALRGYCHTGQNVHICQNPLFKENDIGLTKFTQVMSESGELAIA